MDIIDILLLILYIVTFVALICYFFYKLAKSYVIKNSDALENLYIINSEYAYMFNFDISENQHYTKRQKSKHAFDIANSHDLLIEYLYKYGDSIRYIIEEAKKNALCYTEYSAKCNSIYENRSTEWYKLKIHKKIEASLFEAEILNPPRNVSLKIENRYTSPKKRNRYANYCIISAQQIENAFTELDQIEKAKLVKQHERSKMSDSLRYDIMKRDNFKCVLCGSSANDGVKLHVDHIIPIAKGGLTVSDNLRTLCERCNLGKSDKYDPNGIN